MSPISAEEKLDYVKSKIGEYPNFPKEGILFRWVIARGYRTLLSAEQFVGKLLLAY